MRVQETQERCTDRQPPNYYYDEKRARRDRRLKVQITSYTCGIKEDYICEIQVARSCLQAGMPMQNKILTLAICIRSYINF